jgi:hypothetical protein
MTAPLVELPDVERARIGFLWLIHTFDAISGPGPIVTASKDLYGTEGPDRNFDGADPLSHHLLTLEYDGFAEDVPSGRPEAEAFARANGFDPDPSSWQVYMGGFEERLSVAWRG